MQQSNQVMVTREKHEEKDYLYINMWLLLALIGAIIALVVQIFPQSFDNNTLAILALIILMFTCGSATCVHLALKKHTKQICILTWFCFFLSLFSVVVGIIAVYDNKKFTAIVSLLLTVPISFFGMLPTFYYGDKREHETHNPDVS